MSQPPAYVPVHAFVADSAALANFPGQQLDVEFQDIKTTTDAIRTNLALIQRDDGGLANNIVTYDSLSVSLQGAGLQPAVAWSTGVAFAVGANVFQSSSLYRGLVAHTSGVFATDLAAGKWVLVGALTTGPTGPAGPANTLAIGTVTSGAAAATITGSAPNQTLNLVLQTGSSGGVGATGSGYGGTSATSLLIANSVSKTFTTQAGLAYQVGSYVRASSAANGANFMEGLVSSYSGTTLIIAVTAIGGAGTFADWGFTVSGSPGTGNVNGSGASVVGNLPAFSNTGSTALIDSGGSLANLPGRTPTTSTVTVTIATPGVMAWTAHGLPAGTPLTLATTGALPTGLVVGTDVVQGTAYYVIPVDADHFRLATSYANALAGTAINTTGSQSGTHTAVANGVFVPGTRGYIYESEVLSGSAVNIPFQVATEITRLTLPVGVYDVTFETVFTTAGGALTSEVHTTVSKTAPPTIVGLPNQGGADGAHTLQIVNQSSVYGGGPKRIIITAASTPVYLSLYLKFGTNAGVGDNGSGTVGAFGYIRAKVV